LPRWGLRADALPEEGWRGEGWRGEGWRGEGWRGAALRGTEVEEARVGRAAGSLGDARRAGVRGCPPDPEVRVGRASPGPRPRVCVTCSPRCWLVRLCRGGCSCG